MRFIMSILFCLYLTGCTSTKVHFYTRYLPTTDVSKITKALEDANFTVVKNRHAFPEDIEQSAVLYSLFIQDDKSVSLLTKTLTEIGWPIQQTRALVAGNHWYTKNSVGLYLLPDGVKTANKVATQDLADDYQSRNCNESVKISLKDDNRYTMMFSENKESKADHLNGYWKVRSYPYLELTSLNEQWWFYFEIEQKIEVDKVSKIQIVELKPVDQYRFFPNCSFVTGVRL